MSEEKAEYSLYEGFTTATIEPPEKQNGTPATIRFTVTQERIERLTVDELIAMEEAKSTREMRDALALFVMGPHGYLPFEAAVKEVGRLTISELTETAQKVTAQMQDAAAPK